MNIKQIFLSDWNRMNLKSIFDICHTLRYQAELKCMLMRRENIIPLKVPKTIYREIGSEL